MQIIKSDYESNNNINLNLFENKVELKSIIERIQYFVNLFFKSKYVKIEN